MITLYSSPTCGYCHMLKNYLDSKKVKYTEKNIANDQEAFHWVSDVVGQAVTPVTDIDGVVVVGFDRQGIDTALQDKGYI